MSPHRPALTWWQRALVRAVPSWLLCDCRWFRAHVGGRWALRNPMPFDDGGYEPHGDGPCPGARLPRSIGGLVYGCDHSGCRRCEVYPYPALRQDGAPCR